MKKVFYTIIFSCLTFFASAQFTVVSTVESPNDDENWGISNFTQNMGIGYSINERTMIGAVKNGDDYDVFARYDMGIGFVCLDAPTEDASDNIKIGYGMNIGIWKNLSFTPRYIMPLNEDNNGEREGKFSMGLTYNL